jgi:RNA polymerase sigma-70 factor, ECF subfamily
VGRQRTVHWAEADLVEAARRGDRSALNELLERHYDLVHAICRRVLWRSHHADALEQARQEALLRIARGIAGYNGDSQLTSWIHRIATNAALDALKRHDRTPPPTDVPDHGSGASVAESVSTRMRIDQCLEELPERYRQPVVLCFLCDLDYDEIAAQLGIAVGTVKSRVHRGRAALKHCLSQGADEPDVQLSGTAGVIEQSHQPVQDVQETEP